MAGTEKTCEWCGELFTPRNGDLNRGYGRCCSRGCAAAHREAMKRGEGSVFPETDVTNWNKYHDLDIEDDY